jgi:uncharacterized membrane protein YeaQ/YmgE (transglycosylase-associated protein family)
MYSVIRSIGVFSAALGEHRAELSQQQPPMRWEGRSGMSVIGWIVLGALAGWIGSLLVNKTGEGLLRDIVLGIVGAVVGGWIVTMFGSTGVTGFNLWSLFVAVIGSVVVLVAYHALTGGRSSRV